MLTPTSSPDLSGGSPSCQTHCPPVFPQPLLCPPSCHHRDARTRQETGVIPPIFCLPPAHPRFTQHGSPTGSWAWPTLISEETCGHQTQDFQSPSSSPLPSVGLPRGVLTTKRSIQNPSGSPEPKTNSQALRSDLSGVCHPAQSPLPSQSVHRARVNCGPWAHPPWTPTPFLVSSALPVLRPLSLEVCADIHHSLPGTCAPQLGPGAGHPALRNPRGRASHRPVEGGRFVPV